MVHHLHTFTDIDADLQGTFNNIVAEISTTVDNPILTRMVTFKHSLIDSKSTNEELVRNASDFETILVKANFAHTRQEFEVGDIYKIIFILSPDPRLKVEITAHRPYLVCHLVWND